LKVLKLDACILIDLVRAQWPIPNFSYACLTLASYEEYVIVVEEGNQII